MANKFYWTPDPTQTITSFDIERSTDHGSSFAALVNIPFNVNGANYDKQRKQFFYEDAAGQPGYIYRIVANGAFGVSVPLTIVAPPAEPELCTIIGYVRDASGYVDRTTAIHVTAVGSPEEHWAPNPEGLVAHNAHALGIVAKRDVIHPDENGMWQVDLIRGIYARIEIPALMFQRTFEVPRKAGPINVRDIAEVRGRALALFGDVNAGGVFLPES